MTYYVVETGLTRRLVEASDDSDARDEFVKDVPIRRHFGGLDEILEVRLASDAEIAEFQKRRRAQFDGQIAFEMHVPVVTKPGTGTGKKGHA